MTKRNNIAIFAKLIILLKPLLLYMFLAIILGLLGHLCATYVTVLGGYFILDVLKVINGSIKILALILLIIALARGILRYGEQALNHYIAFKLLAHIRNIIFKKLRQLSPAKLECKEKGNLISLITSDVELLEVFYAHTISPIAIALLYTTTLVMILIRRSIILALILLISHIMIGVMIPYISTKINNKVGLRYRKLNGELSSYLLESIRGIKEIIQYDNFDKRLENINNKMEQMSKCEAKMKNSIGINNSLNNIAIVSFIMINVWISITLLQQGKISYDTLIISNILLMSSFGPAIALSNLATTLENTIASANRIIDLLEEDVLVKDIEKEENNKYDKIKVNDLSFGYNEELILKDVNLEINSGEIIGINGKSGCGKSTLLKLLMRFWQVKDQMIKFNDHDINAIDTLILRNNQGYLTQTTHLFSDTIENNIKIAKPNATKEEVIDACQKASIHDFIIGLENGYDTKLSELGDNISDGEKQRIGLARVFLKDANIMLLDEPTSNVDSLNEAIMLRSIAKQSKNKTILLVSHRLSTLKIANKIYKMKSGKIC